MSDNQELDDQPSLQEQLETMEQEAQLYRSLLQHPGWAVLDKQLQQQADQAVEDALLPVFNHVDSRQRLLQTDVGAILERSDGMTEFSRQEFGKGVRVGILMMKGFPSAQLEYLKGEVKAFRALIDEQETGDNAGTSES